MLVCALRLAHDRQLQLLDLALVVELLKAGSASDITELAGSADD